MVRYFQSNNNNNRLIRVVITVWLLLFVDVTNNVSSGVSAASDRIVGGVNVTSADKYPFYAIPANSSYLCGATLIWGDILVTAAHCADSWTNGTGIWLGGTKIGRLYRNTTESKFYTIKKVIVHPNFNKVSILAYDVALIQLNKFISNVPYAKLNFDKTIPKAGTGVTAIGYGLTSEKGSISYTLREVNLTIGQSILCKLSYIFIFVPIIDQVMLCIRGLPKGGKAVCNGDSGSPILLRDITTPTIVGIVSFGLGCARPFVPQVNTRVSGIAAWINNTICSLGGPNHTIFC